MASHSTSLVVGVSTFALAAGVALGVVGDTNIQGTNAATTQSGAVVTAGGGLQTMNASGTRFTTDEADTLSGSVIRNTAGDISIDATDLEFTTASGATFRTTAGDTVINSAGVETIDTLSGSYLYAKPLGSGSGVLVLDGGAKGIHTCYQDTDGAGWTECHWLNGTQTCAIASAQYCP